MPTHHTPSQDIAALGDLSFHAALEAALMPSDAYDVSSWLFVPHTYTEYRYILGTRGEKPLICLGVNPSTAEPDHLDPTLQSVQRIALHNGYDSFIMLNVYAQRATAPGDMSPDMNAALHTENLQAFRYALSLSPDRAVWAAWGNVVTTRSYLLTCVRDLYAQGLDFGARWYRCGRVSTLGHPHHPLYLKRDEPLVPFDMAFYVQNLVNAPRRAGKRTV